MEAIKIEKLQEEHSENKDRLDRLLNLRVDNEITKEEYEKAKSDLNYKQSKHLFFFKKSDIRAARYRMAEEMGFEPMEPFWGSLL